MKLAVENHYVRRVAGDTAAIRMLAEAGFDGIDFSFYKLTGDDPLYTASDIVSYAAGLKALAAENNISFVQAHAPFEFKYGDCNDSEGYKKIVWSMRIAALLGIPHIVVHAVKPIPCGVDALEYNRAFYRSLIPYCEEFGIKIAVENLFIHDKVRECFSGWLGTPDAMTDFVRSLGSDRFIACLDIGHTALTGVEPENYIRGMSSDLLLSLHVQDNDYRGDRHFLPFCGGKLRWNEICRALGEINYRGDFTMEILHYLDKYSLDFLPEALAFAAKTGRYLIGRVEAAR